MKKRLKIFTLFLLLGLSLNELWAHSDEPSSEKPFISSERSFINVGKKAIPAVVSIKVQGSSRAALGQNWTDSEDQTDVFGDELFSHFFGLPFKRRSLQTPVVEGLGSGFMVSHDGYILTNNHIVQDADKISVTLNTGEVYPAKLIGGDKNTDVALIKIEGKNLPYLVLGNSSDIEVGEWVVAIGNPFGLQATLTVGVVSAKDRSNLGLTEIEDFIQTDAAINRGNSGGPLLDLNANVIGINTAIATASNNGGYVGVGFAVPSNIAEQIMQQIITRGSVTRGYIGVVLQKVDSDLASAFGLKRTEGALVAEVAKDSPAEKAGIKSGDIILKYNNEKVDNIALFRNDIALMNPGSPVDLVIQRDHKLFKTTLNVADFPGTLTKNNFSNNKFGLSVQQLTPELSRSLGLSEEQGVVITGVELGSLAQMSGIKKGALILSINNQRIENMQDFNRIMQNIDEEKPLVLLIKQGNITRFISIRTS